MDHIELTSELVSAYVSNNAVQTADLPGLIAAVHSAIVTLGQPKPQAQAERPTPAVPVKKSITPEHLISLEDGKRYKALKRHLSGLGMTPQDYRAKWGLPRDYPMVSPNYAAKRSELAKAAGLGRKRQEEPAQPAAKSRSSRGKKGNAEKLAA